MNLNVLVLPGDGIGEDVTHQAVGVLRRIADKFHHQLELADGLPGGIAIHQTGTPLPEETLRLAAAADATLMGADGLPEFDQAPAEKRLEKGLPGLGKALGVYANLRPVRAYAPLLDSSPLKNHLAAFGRARHHRTGGGIGVRRDRLSEGPTGPRSTRQLKSE